MSAPAPIRYDAACRAIAAVVAIDEVKDWRDKAIAMRVYARQAKNRQLEIDAAEIRLRAERRLGELIATHRAAGRIRSGSPDPMCVPKTGSSGDRVILAQTGIDYALARRASAYAALPAADFEAGLAQRRALIERGASRVPLDIVLGDKAARRAAREAELGAEQCALPDRRYGVILADPEWRFEPWSRVTGLDRAADNHYPTSELAALCSRTVAAIAAPDCVLALWATVPMLAEAFCVLDAWGFARFDRDAATGHLALDKRAGRYVSSGTWVKYRPGTGIGMGHWFRVDHEILLVATRGQPPAPARGAQARSVFDEPASAVHSEKPELVAELLEATYPTLPKIELNRRGPPRPGWDAWGYEAELEAVA